MLFIFILTLFIVKSLIYLSINFIHVKKLKPVLTWGYMSDILFFTFIIIGSVMALIFCIYGLALIFNMKT